MINIESVRGQDHVQICTSTRPGEMHDHVRIRTEIICTVCTDLYESVRALTCGVRICTDLYMILPVLRKRAAPQAVGLGARTDRVDSKKNGGWNMILDESVAAAAAGTGGGL